MKMNHTWMMVLCCALPILLVFGALYYFKLPSQYLVWLPLIFCLLSHAIMMKFMHKGEGKKGGCH